MKYIVAIIGALVVFFGAGLVLAIIFVYLSPQSWREHFIDLGFASVNIPVLAAIIIASLAATNSFWASIRIAKKQKKA